MKKIQIVMIQQMLSSIFNLINGNRERSSNIMKNVNELVFQQNRSEKRKNIFRKHFPKKYSSHNKKLIIMRNKNSIKMFRDIFLESIIKQIKK